MGWLKPEHSSQCPNVIAMITRFNELSCWVATMIVKVELLTNRVKMYAKMISIAQVSPHPVTFGVVNTLSSASEGARKL